MGSTADISSPICKEILTANGKFRHQTKYCYTVSFSTEVLWLFWRLCGTRRVTLHLIWSNFGLICWDMPPVDTTSGSRSRSGDFGEEKSPSFLPRMKPRFLLRCRAPNVVLNFKLPVEAFFRWEWRASEVFPNLEVGAAFVKYLRWICQVLGVHAVVVWRVWLLASAGTGVSVSYPASPGYGVTQFTIAPELCARISVSFAVNTCHMVGPLCTSERLNVSSTAVYVQRRLSEVLSE
jgi:hypothetical protein